MYIAEPAEIYEEKLREQVMERESLFKARFGEINRIIPSVYDFKPAVKVFEFKPDKKTHRYTYITSGLSDARFAPTEFGHKIEPGFGIELMAYSSVPAGWIATLLMRLSAYVQDSSKPFHYGHTIDYDSPVDEKNGNLNALLFILPDEQQPYFQLSDFDNPSEPGIQKIDLVMTLPVHTSELDLLWQLGLEKFLEKLDDIESAVLCEATRKLLPGATSA